MSLHQLHEATPGLIHEVSASSLGRARSVMSVESLIAPGVLPTTTTRHGETHGSVNTASCGATPYVSSASGNRTCELGMEHATGQPYESIIVTLERQTR